MEIINLGATDGLPPVNWGNILEKLDAVAAGSRRPQRSHDVAFDAERGWSPPRDVPGPDRVLGGGCNVARDPRRSIAVSILDADVVAEGEAERETDRANSPGPPCQGLGRPGVACRT